MQKQSACIKCIKPLLHCFGRLHDASSRLQLSGPYSTPCSHRTSSKWSRRGSPTLPSRAWWVSLEHPWNHSQMEEWRMKHLSLCWTSIVNSWETWNLFIQDMWIHVNLYRLGHVRTTKFLTSWSSWDESPRYSPHNRDILIMVPTQGFIMFYPRRKVICVYLKIPLNLLTNHHLYHSKLPFWGYTVYSPFSDTHQSLSHQGISSGSAPGSTTTM